MTKKNYPHFSLITKDDLIKWKEIEEKWQILWKEKKVFFTDLEKEDLPKKYILAMFPYPSGSGLHIGHIRVYTISDVIARFYRFKGYNVFFPIGWDSFGLPAEQYALRTGNHPKKFTDKNISNFKKQLKKLGYSYDWEKELKTSDEDYYGWTQWMFLQIYKLNLAEYKKTSVHWCDELGTVLANEEVKRKKDGFLYSDFGNHKVVDKDINQWIIKITSYADKLLNGLTNLNWPESIKKSQINWINKVDGFVIKLPFFNDNNDYSNGFIDVFAESLNIMRYNIPCLILSFSNQQVFDILKYSKNEELKKKVNEFCEFWKKEYINGYYPKSEQFCGIFLGIYCKNIYNNLNIPVWIVNYSSDKNNFANFFSFSNFKDVVFCRKYSIEIDSFLSNFDKENIFNDDDVVNLIKKNGGFLEKKIIYDLKDWVFSRQRYWGEPIPIIHFYDINKKKWEKIIDEKLPLILPELDDFRPDKKFYSPLQKANNWVNLLIKYNGNFIEAQRDINVMPQWAGSCWYYIAFLLKNIKELTPLNSDKAKRILKKWLPVDVYVGGQEHANLHLLYSRFWHKVLNEINIVFNDEPFKEFICQGMILGKDGKKMSKSLNNFINPDYLIDKYGADALRIYVLSIGPIDKDFKMEFDDAENKIEKKRKWLNRVFRLIENVSVLEKEEINSSLFDYWKKMIKSVNYYYENKKFNLVISSLETFINECYKCKNRNENIPKKYFLDFLRFLNPIAPHISEEMWSFFSKDFISFDKNWSFII